jgi:hypothetical protein
LIDFPILCHKALQYLRNFATSIWPALGEELVSQMLVAISAGIVMLCDDIKWENLSKNYLAAKVALG